MNTHSHPSWALMSYPYENHQKEDPYYTQRNPQQRTHGLYDETDKDRTRTRENETHRYLDKDAFKRAINPCGTLTKMADILLYAFNVVCSLGDCTFPLRFLYSSFTYLRF